MADLRVVREQWWEPLADHLVNDLPGASILMELHQVETEIVQIVRARQDIPTPLYDNEDQNRTLLLYANCQVQLLQSMNVAELGAVTRQATIQPGVLDTFAHWLVDHPTEHEKLLMVLPMLSNASKLLARAIQGRQYLTTELLLAHGKDVYVDLQKHLATAVSLLWDQGVDLLLLYNAPIPNTHTLLRLLDRAIQEKDHPPAWQKSYEHIRHRVTTSYELEYRNSTIGEECFDVVSIEGGAQIQRFLKKNPNGLALVVLRKGQEPQVTCTNREQLQHATYTGQFLSVGTHVGNFKIDRADQLAILRSTCRIILLYPDHRNIATVSCQDEGSVYNQLRQWLEANPNTVAAAAGFVSAAAALLSREI